MPNNRTGWHTAPVPGNPPLGTSPTDGRLILGALFGTTGQCLSGGTLTPSATTMTFALGASVYQIPDTANAGAIYQSPIDADSVTPSAGQAGGRIDSVYINQQDYEKNGTTSRVILGIVAGTAGSGAAPAVPAGTMRIARISVPASATKATDCGLTYDVPPAGLAYDGPVTTTKALLDLIPGAYAGQFGYVLATNVSGTTMPLTYRWTGSWEIVPTPNLQTHARWMSATDQTLGNNGWTPIQFDTFVTDPLNMKPSSGGTNFTIPIAGRWSLFMRGAVTNDALSDFYVLGFYNVSAGSFMSQRGQVGMKSNVPTEHYTEEILAAGVQFQASIYRATSTQQWLSHGASQIWCAPQMIARYLGPA